MYLLAIIIIVMAKKKVEKKKTTIKKATKPISKKVESAVEVQTEAVQGEVVVEQPQVTQKQGNGKKWCCCCGIIFVIFILLWVLVQILSFSGMMPLPFIF